MQIFFWNPAIFFSNDHAKILVAISERFLPDSWKHSALIFFKYRYLLDFRRNYFANIDRFFSDCWIDFALKFPKITFDLLERFPLEIPKRLLLQSWCSDSFQNSEKFQAEFCRGFPQNPGDILYGILKTFHGRSLSRNIIDFFWFIFHAILTGFSTVFRKDFFWNSENIHSGMPKSILHRFLPRNFKRFFQ